MEDISEVKVGPMPQSLFLKPLRMDFVQNGKKRYWDFVKLHEGVAVILFNRVRGVLVFVKQFRPAVYYGNTVTNTADNSVPDVDWTKVPAKNGITIELCAGIVDEKISLAEIAKKEVFEECGYDVPLDAFESVISYRSGVGVSGDKINLYYAEISDEMKTAKGGGLVEEGEMIDVIELSIEEVRKFIQQDSVPSPAGFLFAMYWFLANKAPQGM